MTEAQMERRYQQATEAANKSGFALESLHVLPGYRWRAVLRPSMFGTWEIEADTFHGLLHQIEVSHL